MLSAHTRSCTPRSVRSVRDDLAGLPGRLVEIESTNPDLVPEGVGEAGVDLASLERCHDAYLAVARELCA